MPVQTDPSHLRILLATFEARFDDAYRFFDSAGSVVSGMRALDPHWAPVQIQLDQGLLLNEESQTTVRFTHDRLILSRNGDDWIPHLTGEKIAKRISEQIEPIYSLVTEALKIPNTIRVGSRFSYLAPAESLEEAQVFVARRITGDLRTSVESVFSSALFNGQVRFEVENVETGYRRNITLTTLTRTSGVTPLVADLNVPGPKESAVQIDIDLYTRPTDGHFTGLRQFIMTSFNTSRDGAISLFRSM